jgi:curved DNA-binding protein CbpA
VSRPRPRPINFYDILGVPPDAAAADIRLAYLARIGQYHPDRNQARHATAIAALVNEAWAVLGDADRRRQYDLAAGIARESAGAAKPAPAERWTAPASTGTVDPPPQSASHAADAGEPAHDAARSTPTGGAATAAAESDCSGDASAVPPVPPSGASRKGFGSWLRGLRRAVSAATGNRRGETRLKTLFTVSVDSAVAPGTDRSSTQHTCLDLSPRGLAFTMSQPLSAGALVSVTLELPDGRLAASATVVRREALKRSGRWKIGVEFRDLSGADRRRIRDFVRLEGQSRAD